MHLIPAVDEMTPIESNQVKIKSDKKVISWTELDVQNWVRSKEINL